MKNNILIIAVIVTVVLGGLYSCNRDYTLKSPVQTTSGTAYLKIVDASPNFRNVLNQADSFNVFVGGNKISGFTPGGTVSWLTFGSIYPTVSSNYGYVSIPAGSQVIKLSVPGVLLADSVAITSLTKTFLPDQLYTLMITDSIASTRDSSQIFVQDSYLQPVVGYFNLRFIHAVLNDTAGKMIDIYSTRTNRSIFTNVKPGSISTFTQYPFNAVLSDTLYVRRSGSPAIVLDTLNTVSFSNGRTYTLYYRGDGTTNYNTNTKRRHLATYLHQ